MKQFLILSITIIGMVYYSFGQEDKAINLVIRADDMGFCHSVNKASIEGYKNGIITTVEVIAPGPWFLDAAEKLKDNPGLDVGVHLCLTSEWDNYKWGPLTNAPSLLDKDGYFPSTTEALVKMDLSKEEVKAEFRAQIELALKHIPQVSHLSTHMFSPDILPVINKAIKELSKEYKLNLAAVSEENYNAFWGVEANKKKDYLLSYLAKLTEGTHIFVVHPIMLDVESKAIKGSGLDPNVNMALHRQKVLEAVMSSSAKIIIEQKGINLIGIKAITDK